MSNIYDRDGLEIDVVTEGFRVHPKGHLELRKTIPFSVAFTQTIIDNTPDIYLPDDVGPYTRKSIISARIVVAKTELIDSVIDVLSNIND